VVPGTSTREANVVLARRRLDNWGDPRLTPALTFVRLITKVSLSAVLV
jgi:hypothetical protein